MPNHVWKEIYGGSWSTDWKCDRCGHQKIRATEDGPPAVAVIVRTGKFDRPWAELTCDEAVIRGVQES